jgi:RNA polymerase sigma-70 factor (ECF subfamily)
MAPPSRPRAPVPDATATQDESDAAVIAVSATDPDRFADLYDRHAASLYRYAYRRVGAPTADDVVADTYLAAFARRGSYDADRPDARPAG